MGNSNTKESRPDNPERANGRRSSVAEFNQGRDHGRESGSRSSRNRASRGELGFFGIGHGASSRDRDRPDAPFERRETKQEREARRLERERVVRAKERERSIREEHIDGGFLVTLGTYTGTEDFSKTVVRQLQIERKMAPFWRGLNDWSESWAEHQLIAAARGLPIPPADAPPDQELESQGLPYPPADPRATSTQNLQNLTVPLGPRTFSAASDPNGTVVDSGGHASSTPFLVAARSKALAALSGSSRNASSTDLTPKEISLPHDPYVNGQRIEVFLYKDAAECPICFLSYPPYLNSTRCCDQPICSECFVQIKRTDPHLPEHHPDGQARDPTQGLTPDDPPEMLISEPSACPYCQQPEFGVTYEPPPFRRGLVYSASGGHHASSTAMSSQSSLNSTLPPTSPSHTGRRRTHSLSANAPNVITTDRVRPDWATKLAAARAHQARRAAAATALHTAAFLMGGTEQRSILRTSRFGRRNTGGNSSANTPTDGRATPAEEQSHGADTTTRDQSRSMANSRRNRMEELEEMMLMEAVRLSLAAEEERKRKEEKALRKEAKKREKEERKALKKQGSNPYGGGSSGASASSLSLGLGRRRGNSTASNLRMEATVQGASQAAKSTEAVTDLRSKNEKPSDKGKGVDRSLQDSPTEPSSSSSSLPIPAAPARGHSHLRQMSNASSIGSSVGDSPCDSYTGPGYLGPNGNNPRSSGLSLGAYSDDGDRDAGSAGTEPMFNFSSLAQMVGANIEDGSAIEPERHDEMESPGTTAGFSRPLSQVKEEDKEEPEAEHIEEGGKKYPILEIAVPGQGANANNSTSTPEVMVTPETPAPMDEVESEAKRLGQPSITEQRMPFAK